MKDTIVLGIESSCDETAAAIVKNRKEVLSSVVASQIDVHKEFGGVVPEVASRIHVENISMVIEEALKQADLSVADVDAIAVTQGPGLIGCLHVGVHAAKTLAWAYHKPLVPVHRRAYLRQRAHHGPAFPIACAGRFRRTYRAGLSEG